MAVTQTAQHVTGHFRRERRSCTPKIAAFLYQLEKAGQLHPDTRIPGVAPTGTRTHTPKSCVKRSKLS